MIKIIRKVKSIILRYDLMHFILISILVLQMAVFGTLDYFDISIRSTSLFSENGSVVSVSKPLPDFSKIKNVKEKKQKFFDYLYPIIKDQNDQLLALRGRVILHQEEKTTRKTDVNWLLMMARDYRCIKKKDKPKKVSDEIYSCLLEKIDIVPASLVMAQAANESAWGTSRFARKGNNLFGVWCHVPGCGIVPSRRGKGDTHEVAKYKTVDESVQKYMRHINKHKNYSMLRDIRSRMRKNKQRILGGFLANGLEHYSARGSVYVDALKSIIRINKLHKYDE